MKTENRQRELAFLNYLNALDSGDIEAISHFLEQAEEDELLENMMLDYHEQDQNKHEEPQTETPMKTIVPFKLKREHTRRMIQIAGLSTVAALLLITVGMAGLILGMRQSNSLIADSQHCRVSLANADNTVNLIGGDDIESPLHVGVNNPFTVYLNTGDTSTGYQVIFEGLRAIVDYDDLLVEGDCSEYRAITVYPQGACTIEMEHVRFPLGGSDQMNEVLLISDMLVALDYVIDDAYPIIDDRFVGRISEWYVDVSDGCENYPLLYVPPRFDEKPPYMDWSTSTKRIVDIDKLRIREQRFENGIMLHIEAIDEVWVSYYDFDGIQRWNTYSTEWLEGNYVSDWLDAPEGFFEPERGMFSQIWRFTLYDPELGKEIGRFGDQIGWAISEPVTYMASYTYPTSGEGVNIEDWYHHFIETSTGEVYEFFPSSQYYPSVDTPEWRVVDTDD